MDELKPHIAKAIMQIVTERVDKLFVDLDDFKQQFEQREDAKHEQLKHMQEVWKLGADLWREQSKVKLADMDGLYNEMSDLCHELGEEVLALQEQNAQLIDDLGKAYAFRLEPKGGFNAGTTYHSGNVVLRDGAAWWCCAESTDADPREPSGDWRLLSMRGARGTKGDRGQKGETGLDGKDGQDGATILDGQVSGLNLAFALSDGSAVHVSLEGLRDTLAGIVKAEVAAALKRVK